MDNKNILITGGGGFIGSNLAISIQNKFPKSNITIFDRFNNYLKRTSNHFQSFGDFKNLIDFTGTIISGDLNNEKDLLKLLENKFDIIFHQAAISDTTVINQEEVLKTNTNSFFKFLEYTKLNNSKLIYASSAGTYGNTLQPNCVGIGEIPENIYGFSKLCMDNMTRKFLKENPSCHIVGLRYFNVYGNRELYKRKTSSMILQLSKQALEFKKIRLFEYGEQKRDFVYINDVVEANLNSIHGIPGIYNVGTGTGRSFNDVHIILEKILNSKIHIEYVKNPYDFYQNNTCAELSSSRENINYNPKFNLETGINDYFKFIINYSDTEWKSFYE